MRLMHYFILHYKIFPLLLRYYLLNFVLPYFYVARLDSVVATALPSYMRLFSIYCVMRLMRYSILRYKIFP